VTILVRSGVVVFDPGHERVRLAALATWRRKGRVPKGEARVARFFRMHRPDTDDPREWILLPRGLLHRVVELYPNAEVVDRRLTVGAVEFGWRGTLWPEQREAVRPLLEADGGILVGPPGSGKTQAGLALIAACRQPALWIVNSKDLALQALQRARSLFNLPARAFGLLGGGNAVLGTHFTACMVQTLMHIGAAQLDRIAEHFGCVVVDEVHMTPARVISQIVSHFPARYRYGLTATPYRSDGLDEAIGALFGPAVGVIDRRHLLRRGRIVLPKVVGVPTPFVWHGDTFDWARIQTARASDRRRNHLLCSLVQRQFRAGRHVLVLVDRKAHAHQLAELLSQRYGTPAFAVTGPVPPRVRQRAYDLLEQGRVVLVATRLADQGLDLPALDCLVLGAAARGDALTDDKAPTPRLEQQVGRVMRARRGKETPVIWDLWDVRVEPLRRQIAERIAIYRRLGLRVEQASGSNS